MLKAILPVAIHEPKGRSTHLNVFWRELARDLFSARHFAWELFRRNLVSQCRHSAFGIFSGLLPVLAITGWAVLFRQASLLNVGDMALPCPLFVLLGMMIWSVFTELIDAPISGLLAEQGLISKSNVPPEAVTLARLGLVAFNLVLKSVVIALAALYFLVPPQLTILLVPFALLPIVALGTGIGLVLAPINLLYGDVARLVPIATTFWLFLTPVFYIPPREGVSALLMRYLNPFTPLLETTRDLVFGGAGGIPEGFLLAAPFALLVLAAGTFIHRVVVPVVIDRANA